jgi:hypothetical protein
MKLRVVMDVDVSPTMADTIQRTGLALCPDGSGLKVQIPNSPAIPKRKTRVVFVEEPTIPLAELKESK